MTATRTFKYTLVVALCFLATVTAAASASGTAASRAHVTKIRLDLGVWPGSVLNAYGSIWVASHVGSYVYRIDPHTNRVTNRIKVGENQCVDLVAGAGAVWVWNCSGETGEGIVYEINARTNRVVGHFPKQTGTFGDGSLWAQSEDWTRLERIDPKSHLVLRKIKLPIPLPATGHVFPAVFCGGSIWSVADTSVIRYDTAKNRVASVIPLPRATSELGASWFSATYAACAGGKVWVPNLAGLYSIDMRTNRAKRLRIRVHKNSQLGDPGVTAGRGQVFVRTSDTTVTQVDPRTGKVVRTYPAGGGGGEQIAVGFGSVWIPAATDGSVWREQISPR